MRFRVEASVGNADGVFDAAYDFGEGSGEEAAIDGNPTGNWRGGGSFLEFAVSGRLRGDARTARHIFSSGSP